MPPRQPEVSTCLLPLQRAQGCSADRACWMSLDLMPGKDCAQETHISLILGPCLQDLFGEPLQAGNLPHCPISDLIPEKVMGREVMARSRCGTQTSWPLT